MERRQRYANLPIPTALFRDFQVLPGTENALATSRALAEGMAERPLLSLVGRNGCGKSHLLQSIGGRLFEQGVDVRYTYVPELLDLWRQTYDPEAEESFERVFQTWATASVLLLDDIGRGKITPWAVEKLERIVEDRYRGRLCTVFATNKTMDWMAANWSPMLADRLWDTGSGRVQVVTITAPSYRTGQAWSKQ